MKTYVKYSLIGWLIFVSIMTWVIYGMSNMQTALVRSGSVFIPLIILFYLNLVWFLPSYLNEKKRSMYAVAVFLAIAIHVVTFGWLDVYLDKSMHWDLPHISERHQFMVFFGRLMSSAPPLIISALIWKSILLHKQREQSMELQNRMLEAETKALKAQINPHFLFNSMNNIYALSQIKSDKTGDAILSLSEILRFVTYESEKDRVSLKDELKQITNFIQLQLLKDDVNENVHVEIEDSLKEHFIAPMLLLPFIENSFKHSNFEDKVNGWIKIGIKVTPNKLHLALSNSASLKNARKDEIGGVGMENVKKRLSLIYPEKHKLVISQNETTYRVNLELDLA